MGTSDYLFRLSSNFSTSHRPNPWRVSCQSADLFENKECFAPKVVTHLLIEIRENRHPQSRSASNSQIVTRVQRPPSRQSPSFLMSVHGVVPNPYQLQLYPGRTNCQQKTNRQPNLELTLPKSRRELTNRDDNLVPYGSNDDQNSLISPKPSEQQCKTNQKQHRRI